MKPQKKVIDKIKANRKAYLEALRSGRWFKNKNALMSTNGHYACALGVWFRYNYPKISPDRIGQKFGGAEGWRKYIARDLGMTYVEMRRIEMANDFDNLTLNGMADWIEREIFK